MEQNPVEKPQDSKPSKPANQHIRKKRPAPRPARPLESEIYITTKSNFKAQQKRCENLLNSGLKDIYLHCCGNAINRGINLALELVNKSDNALTYAINTSTIHLIDEYHPLCDEDDITYKKRNNSALHIRISRNFHFDVNVSDVPRAASKN